MAHKYYSQRAGLGPHPNGLPLNDILDLFGRLYRNLEDAGYFAYAFGHLCVDAGWITGTVGDVELDIRLATRKDNLWPLSKFLFLAKEDDLFDFVEYLYQKVSKPIKGTLHTYGDCGMHWEVFDQPTGQKEFREKINLILDQYERKFQLSENGEILVMPERGFEEIFRAKIHSTEPTVLGRIESAIVRFRRHGSTRDDRRQAVRDLADVLEALGPQMEGVISNKDESDLFNIANNFSIRHNNNKQKVEYDPVWLNWMFYVYLSTIHVILRRIEQGKKEAAKKESD